VEQTWNDREQVPVEVNTRMSITNCKPQQQTLSIRVPASVREFLELAREVIADARGEPVSISDAAKFLLESAMQDRLDFRLEAAELQQSPTAALLQIRTKWERQQYLSRAEWVLLARYVQVACEEASARPLSLVAVPEALLAVRALRVDRGGGLDRVYLGNLGVPVATAFRELQFDLSSCHRLSAIESEVSGRVTLQRRTLLSEAGTSISHCGRRR
jgi:hypothetical protein